jgi:hypothetical protein
MLGTHDLLLFIVSGWLLNVTPGPDMLYIIGRSTGTGAARRESSRRSASAQASWSISARPRSGCRRFSPPLRVHSR